MNFCLTRCWINSRPGCRQAGAGPPFRYSGPPGPCSCPEQGNNLPCYFSSPRSLIRHRLYRNRLIRRLFPGCDRRGARTVRPCSLRGNRGEQGKSPDRGPCPAATGQPATGSKGGARLLAWFRIPRRAFGSAEGRRHPQASALNPEGRAVQTGGVALRTGRAPTLAGRDERPSPAIFKRRGWSRVGGPSLRR